MSDFNGSIEEIPKILVDNFHLRDNPTGFFLSHIHTDHTQGLLNPIFLNYLTEHNLYVYTSHISKLILENQNCSLKGRLKTLEINRPSYFDINGLKICVTALPAGHCLGSLMLLFETATQRILYTGDFRLENSEVKGLKGLHYNSEFMVKKIDNLYLDTTFFNKNYEWFPKRKESMQVLCEKIREWIDLSPKNILFIKLPAIFGSEWLFIQIYRILKKPVFVFKQEQDPTIYHQVYQHIPELDNVYTINPAFTQIHASQVHYKYQTANVKRLLSSAQYWNKSRLKANFINNVQEIYEEQYGNQIRVCNSEHASYTELLDFIGYLKPERIVPCVVRDGDTELFDNIRMAMSRYQKIEDVVMVKEDSDVEDVEYDGNVMFGAPREGSPDSLLDM